jgi:dTDP-4-amino-4,6-dideoxygalactose transaminase
MSDEQAADIPGLPAVTGADVLPGPVVTKADAGAPTAAILPVCRPGLPGPAELEPWLAQVDASRQYTNRGPLVRRLEARLARVLGLPDHALRSASTGTSAIEIAILASAGPARPERPFALVPSYTFAATALAAERAGYRPVFCDVDPVTWGMDLAAAAAHPDLDRIGLFLPVACFGRLPDLAGAEALMAATGVPVVYDAAASFEALLDRPGHVSARVPVTLSFHATKTFSTAEGGAVLWDSAEGAEALVRAANFGFNFSRRSDSAGTNAKLSEIHAAVGHAMLDRFAQRRADYAATVAMWREVAAVLPGRMVTAPDLASVYVLWEAPDEAAHLAAQAAMTAANIDSRRWYETGLHRMAHFASDQSLPVTEELGARLLGLPMAHDMPRAQMERVVRVILTAIS